MLQTTPNVVELFIDFGNRKETFGQHFIIKI